MGSALSRRRVTATVALAAVAVLAGCTQKPPPDTGVYPGTYDPPAPRSEAPRLTATEPPSASQWPDKAVPAGQTPRLGASKVIAPGYRVDSFLSGLASRWEVPLGEQRLIEAPGDRKVWHFSGKATEGPELAIAGVPTEQGDIVSFTCLVDVGREKAAEFLEDCAATGIPGWDRGRAVAWLKTARRQVDAVYAREKGMRPASSALYVSDGAYAFLSRAGQAKNPDGAYTLRVSGGGVAENS
ncbi:hypothetical protein [Streptomyces sp. c-19]|uniref:hypothetical protein n=1 Tax=Streptomyces sp. c-19 TaxID=2789275 RepID=UPI00397FB86A